MSNKRYNLDPERDLILERTIDVPRAQVWRAWTEPKLLEQWFCPKPWRASNALIELRPGGAFRTTMHGPNGEEFTNTGCFLLVRDQEELVFTDALGPDFRPSAEPFFTAQLILEDAPGGGTNYTAIGRHRDAEGRKKHEAMGFVQGWGMALDQLVALMKSR